MDRDSWQYRLVVDALKVAERFISDEFETRTASFLPNPTEEEHGYVGEADAVLQSVRRAIYLTELRTDYFGYRVTCTVCGETKEPVGRSSPIGLVLCTPECPGFYLEPLSSHLWPDESEADFGYKVPR